MNEIKVQQDILAMARAPHRVHFGELDDGRTGAVIDGIAVYIIYNDKVLLDKSKFMAFDLRKIFVDVAEAHDIYPSSTHILQEKDTLKEFRNDETTAYFNVKLFKYFDTKKKLTYKYHKTKLFVFENEELVGLVLETRVRK